MKWLALILMLLGATSCVPAPPSPTPLSDEAAIRNLLTAEGASVVAQDIESLATLWAEDGVVTDAAHTPASAADDAFWRGIDAVLDRYVVLVFPGNPQSARSDAIEITVVGDTAMARATTRIGDEVSPGGDVWTFVKRDGRWLIQSLTYNLEP